MLRRKPRGYIGRNHETIGSDILAVLQMLKLPEQVLGESEARRLKAVQTDRWYPIESLLSVMRVIEEKLGYYGLVGLGRRIFKESHEQKARVHLKSARDLVYGIDGMYRAANRGVDIGGWRVLKFEPGYAELEKTTPHHCLVEQGILSAAFAALGTPVTITQSQCFRENADSCIYTIHSPVVSEKWTGK
jgi:hypothetical protein